MKSYEDISERIFKKGDEILKKKQKRTAIIKRTSLTVSGVCAVILISFGVWKNNDIKNALNNNWMNDKQIVTENKDFSKTTTEYTNNGTSSFVMSTASGTAGNSVVFSSMTTLAVTSEKNKISENAVTCTTALNKIYSVSTSQVKTEEITDKKTIDTTEVNTTETQTTVSTAVEINLTGTNTTFLTETTTTSENTDDEEGIYMKKLTSFFTSAVVLAASATPVIGNAEYNIDTSRYWEGEKAMFSRMDSGEFDVDIDGNGVVDALDGYLLECYLHNRDANGYYIICEHCDNIIKCYRYDEDKDEDGIGCHKCGYIYEWDHCHVGLGLSLSDETKERIEAIADYNEDGIVDYDDATSWVRYFVINRNLKVELFNPAYYVSEYVLNDNKYTLCAKNAFIDNLYSHMHCLQAEYDIVAEMYESGIIDLDINKNGQLDIDDIYKFYVDYNFYSIVYD
ncbi:MAG: hypothetical protein K2G83_05035, partial [Ruminococcus sp.]|nr:hypothetical protein [Ruminococcus sp.]